MRALVTGATGFIGATLVRRLLGRGDEVAVLVRPNRSRDRLDGVAGRVAIIEAEPGAWHEAGAAVVDFAPDAMFHLAWAGVHGDERRDPAHLDGNLRRGVELIEIATAARCRVLVGLGSQAEYGPHTGLIDELTPARPVTAYGIGKLALGLLIEDAGELGGMRTAWLRLFSAYGPGDRPDYLIPYVIGELLAGRVPHLTAGDQPHDTLYSDDVAEALIAAVVSDTCRGRYVLASGGTATVREIAEMIRDLVAPEAELDLGAPAGHPGWVGSHARLTRDTGWSPSVTLPIGLEKTAVWWRDHADRGSHPANRAGAGASCR